MRPINAMPFYKVTFSKRFTSEGEESNRPESFVHVVDGVVLNAAKAEVNEPPAMHNQDVMDEDDAFLGIGTESWEYEIAEGREQEFIDALVQSKMVLEYEQMDEVI
jgi:hypothetical protein